MNIETRTFIYGLFLVCEAIFFINAICINMKKNIAPLNYIDIIFYCIGLLVWTLVMVLGLKKMNKTTITN